MDLHHEVSKRIESHVGFRSIRALAREAGIPYSTLHQQLSERRFSLDVVWALAACFDVAVTDLLPPGPTTPPKLD